MINLKASILQPRKANKPDDLDKILADWTYEQKVVTEFDQSEFDEEMKRTILMTIMPKDYVEYMRDNFMGTDTKIITICLNKNFTIVCHKRNSTRSKRRASTSWRRRRTIGGRTAGKSMNM